MSNYQGHGRPQYGGPPPPMQQQQQPYQAYGYAPSFSGFAPSKRFIPTHLADLQLRSLLAPSSPPQHSPQPYPNQGHPSPQHAYYQQGQMQQQQYAYPPHGNSPHQYQQQMPPQSPYGSRPGGAAPSPQHHHGNQQGRQEMVQPPPSAPQHFGSGAPQSYSFKYSQCTGRRKALLIGINYFGQRGQLRGCINDVRNMTSYLAEHFGYRREDMVILTDDQQNPMSQPTKQNILRAMHWLVKDARPNDSLFFHYSGHGGQTKDLDGDEPDGYDEVIYPVDFRQHGHITDDEMHRIMVQPLCAGVRLTAIFDSCHSGTALDLPYIYSTQGILKEPNLAKEAGQGLLGVISSYSQGDLGGMGSQIVSLFKKATSGEEAHSRALATKTSPADVVMWSGSKDDQTSADASIGLQATGAMSWAFITSLKKNPQQSYVQLLNSLRDELATRYTQKPQLSCSHPLNTDLLFVM
ncbi:Peptidase C14, caspase catalytic [Cordyceps fumosorosea ARSEF 2679]|uniref:Peptidase C14, caspase catalytic n=1 Tax=Cordyceps fumosorosea (strain ARSEF 2679) TaxID=1081104 RepID=A0A168ECM8_CORFA|nr:Peptidase C14, caspase catalytic [Cordyceps fumosorosea ARSEF 2679]OAA73651.1 Peptidase C14, caspase catalytic [Cordyceps fumosorosea ARSEF 2679]